ncbi:MAG: DnaB-like helicase C-terminal domain-containing protein, partial [Candidatus Phytoplasma australasiaticum]|nr:DnaB-like helicase C-terminal domain-containing protein [Candidatus Phytoplasma australasiaticum]
NNRQYGFNNRQEEVSDISKSLKQMARELKIPVIVEFSRQFSLKIIFFNTDIFNIRTVT